MIPFFKPSYIGSWNGRIEWSQDYAKQLVGSLDGVPPVDTRSTGTVVFSKDKSGSLSAMSYWELSSSDRRLSRLAVTPPNFEFDSAGFMRGFEMVTAVREPLTNFVYGPFMHYRMVFTNQSDTRLIGTMQKKATNSSSFEIVGEVVFERR